MTLKLPFLLSAAALAGLAAPLIASASAPATPAKAADGKALFAARCQGCHSVEPGRTSPVGPNLAGVSGRAAASGNFAYSPALKASGLTWTRPNLDAFLKSPMQKVAGTRMPVGVSNATERAAIIDYLARIRG